MVGSRATAATHTAGSKLNELLGVRREILGGSEVEHTPFHLLGLPCIGHQHEGLVREGDCHLGRAIQWGRTGSAVQSHHINVRGCRNLWDAVFNTHAANAFAVGVDGEGRHDGKSGLGSHFGGQ